MVGDLRRRAAERTDREDRRLEPDARRFRGAVPPGARRARHLARRALPYAGRECHRGTQPFARQHARRHDRWPYLDELRRQAHGAVGDRPVGPGAPERRGRRGHGASERRRRRRGTPLAPGAARDELFPAARARRAGAALRRHRRCAAQVARAHRKPLPGRRSGARRRSAGGCAAQEYSGADHRSRRAARAARARGRGADRRAAVRARACRFAVVRKRRPRHSARYAFGASRAPSRRRGRRAARSSIERADRRGEGGVLPADHAHGPSIHPSPDVSVLHRAEPPVVDRPSIAQSISTRVRRSQIGAGDRFPTTRRWRTTARSR